MLEIGCDTPIERRMGVENLVATEQKQNEAERVDPVRHADRRGMPEEPAPALDDRDVRCGSAQKQWVVLFGQDGLRCFSNDTIRLARRPAIHSASTLVDGSRPYAAGRLNQSAAVRR